VALTGWPGVLFAALAAGSCILEWNVPHPISLIHCRPVAAAAAAAAVLGMLGRQITHGGRRRVYRSQSRDDRKNENR